MNLPLSSSKVIVQLWILGFHVELREREQLSVGDGDAIDR